MCVCVNYVTIVKTKHCIKTNFLPPGVAYTTLQDICRKCY